MRAVVVLVLALAGCSSAGKVNLGDSEPDDSGTTPTDDTDTSASNPVVLSVTSADCYADGDGLEHHETTARSRHTILSREKQLRAE